MKNKFWEAQIPNHEKLVIDLSGWLHDSSFYCRETGMFLEQAPDPRHVMVLLTEKERIESQKWIRENRIQLCNWQIGGSEDEIIWQYIFRFKSEEEAMAFKLRWS